jgi:lipopolysaccharide transport system permease protein
VYAATGQWAKVLGKEGLVLRIDRWRDRAGGDVDPPKEGIQALVLGEPERPIGLSISLVALPLLVLFQGVFMLGLGCLLSTFNLFVRDTYHVVGVFLTVWMFATPIFYPERLVHDAGYGWVPGLNPVSWLISCYREVLVYGAWPDPMLLLRFGVASVVLLFLGSSFFMRHKPRFPDLL